jgi:hypothetical protein
VALRSLDRFQARLRRATTRLCPSFATQEFLNIGATLEKQNKAIKRIAAALKVSVDL